MPTFATDRVNRTGIPCLVVLLSLLIAHPLSAQVGACCIGTGCSLRTLSACNGVGGEWQGPGTDCSPNPCDVAGRCCNGGSCTIRAQSACAGSWVLGGVCSPNPCPGRCCTAGTCTLVTQAVCASGGGSWSTGFTCSPTACPSACCGGSECTILSQAACAAAGRAWVPGSACTPAACAPDTCAGAIAISTGTPAIVGDNSTATTDTTISTPSSKDVWYSFTAAAAGGLYDLNTQGSAQPDTVLAVFDSCGGQLLARNNDADGTLHARINPVQFEGNQTVKIRVASFGTAAAGGGFRLDVVQTVSGVGACCDRFGFTCVATVGSSACPTGIYLGDGTTCTPDTCPPTGACCVGPCCRITRQVGCAGEGAWTMGGTCAGSPCGIAVAPQNDLCEHAAPLALGVPIDGFNCTAATEGSAGCALSSRDVWYDFAADSLGGTYTFDTDGSAEPNTVLSLLDACGGAEIACDDDGGTEFRSRLTHQLLPNQQVKVRVATWGVVPGGHFRLIVTREALGACCCGASCVMSTPVACVGANRNFMGPSTSCTPYSAQAPCCRADFNRSGAASVQDIFDYLSGFFADDACADTNDAGGVSVQDLFDFLAAYFAGCP